MLVHLVSLENEDPLNVYNVIRSELKAFDPELLKKEEVVVLTKTDVVSDKSKIEKIVEEFRKITPRVTALTLLDDTQIKLFKDFLLRELSII